MVRHGGLGLKAVLGVVAKINPEDPDMSRLQELLEWTSM